MRVDTLACALMFLWDEWLLFFGYDGSNYSNQWMFKVWINWSGWIH